MFFTEKRNRKKDFKKGIDGDDARRKREDTSVEIRKSKREERIAKKRVNQDGGLANPSMSKENRPAARDPSTEETLRMLPQLCQGIYSSNPKTVVDCLTQFRKLLSIERDPPIQEVIDCGAVPKLVEFLSYNSQQALQFEAAWALTNIASGTTKHTQIVIEAGAVPLFVNLLRSPNTEVREQAVWALGNIAGDSPVCRDLVLTTGALQPLLQLFTPDARITMLRHATWTLSNFCLGKPQPPFELVSPALPTLAQLIFSKDDEVLKDACWALSYLSDDTGPNNQKIQAVIQNGVARRLTELLMHRSPNVITPALRTVGNIVTGNDLQTQVILNCAVLPCLLDLLSNPKRAIKKEACWAISNITAGNPEQIRMVMDANIIPPLIALLHTAEFDVKKEVAWAICNATSGGTVDQIRYLVRQGCIEPLCNMFTCPDPKIITVALEGIENILRVGAKDAPNCNNQNKFADFVEECNGLDTLEELQHHDNEKIYEKASHIIRTYFEGEVEEAANLAPETRGAQFGFQATQNQGGFNFQ